MQGLPAYLCGEHSLPDSPLVMHDLLRAAKTGGDPMLRALLQGDPIVLVQPAIMTHYVSGLIHDTSAAPHTPAMTDSLLRLRDAMQTGARTWHGLFGAAWQGLCGVLC